MSGRRRLVVFLAGLGSLAVSCSESRPHQPAEEAAALGGNVAARVGGETIPASVVGKVSRDEGVSTREALRRLVDDAIAADAARRGALDRQAPTAWLLTAARGRFSADHFLAEARAKGPPTDDEVRELSEKHWREVDRPPAVRVQHVVVRRPSGGDAAAQAALALALRDALGKVTTADEFKAAAAAVAHPKDIEVVIEDLPDFTEDGSLISGGGAMDSTFAKAAHALGKPGQISGVVETQFGWHVIRLVEKTPAQRMPFESRRAAFQEEVVASRARAALEGRLAELTKAAPVSISSGAEALMRGVRVEPPP